MPWMQILHWLAAAPRRMLAAYVKSPPEDVCRVWLLYLLYACVFWHGEAESLDHKFQPQ
jgi:hypothetical protein